MPAIDMKATGENIVRLRKIRGITVKDIQEGLKLSTPNTVYKWQNGVCLPTINNLVILAEILDVSMDEIIVTRRF